MHKTFLKPRNAWQIVKHFLMTRKLLENYQKLLNTRRKQLFDTWNLFWSEVTRKKQVRKPRSYASLKLRPTDLRLTDRGKVKSRATSVANKQARNLERCALKAEKLQHGKLKTLHTWLIPMRKAECGKIEVRPSLNSLTDWLTGLTGLTGLTDWSALWLWRNCGSLTDWLADMSSF